MHTDLEEELRLQMRARAAEFELAPDAITHAVERGRRRVTYRRSIVGGIALMAVGTLGLIGISFDRDTDGPVAVTTDADTSTSPEGEPQLITRDLGDVQGLLAGITGTLVLTPEGCVALGTPGGDSWTGVVWGHGWSVVREGGTVTVYDASRRVFAREGDRVALTGGGISSKAPRAKFDAHPCWRDSMFEANDIQGSQVGR